LDRFQPEYLEAIRVESGNNALLGLPFGTNLWGIVYNKDIFDKFGVAYPKDGMTWDDAYELAKKVTRNDSGTQYKGLDIYTLHSMAQPLSLVTVDAATDRASLNSPGWARVIALAKKINDIPGNALPIVTAAKTKDRFYKDKVVAMLAYDSITAFLTDEAMKQSGINWDMVEYPSYPERPNTHGIVKVSPTYSIASYSKHKDEAMQVIDLLTSDEVQLNYARLGGVPVTKNPETQKQFGAEIQGAQSKNIAGIFKSKPAPFAMQTEYSDRAQGLLNKKFDEIMNGKDYNTAIRELEEQINSEIDTAKTK
jgi:multiple sugar transport system substrate-binding protein